MLIPRLKEKLYLLGLFISTVSTVISIILIIQIIPNIVKNEVYKNVRINQNTAQYSNFLEIPFPLYFKIYFFNIQNPDEILRGAKPIVREIGPYVYKEYRRKQISSIDDEEDSISYRETELFEFDNEASGNLSDTDIITTLNLPLNSVLQTAESQGVTKLISSCISDIFPNIDKLFINVTVKQLVFDGLDFCFKHFSLCEIQRTIICDVMRSKKNIDESNNFLQFSFFNYKNNTDSGLFSVKRGNSNPLELGKILRWNNITHTNFWRKTEVNNRCDGINGTYSSLFPPQITKSDRFNIYSTDVCSSLQLHFVQEKMYREINGYEFVPNNLTFWSTSSSKEESCYCAHQTRGLNGESTCFLDGILDLQPCTGAPVLLSFPHFLWANESYLKQVEGVSPHEDRHKTFLLLEPETGTPLQVETRVQINAILRPIKHIKQTTRLPRVVLPMIWVEEEVLLPDKYINLLQEEYFNKINLIGIVKWVFLGGSVFLTLIFASRLTFKKFLNIS